MVLCLFLFDLIRIFPLAHSFWKRILLSRALLYLSSLREQLTQNLQRLTTT